VQKSVMAFLPPIFTQNQTSNSSSRPAPECQHQLRQPLPSSPSSHPNSALEYGNTPANPALFPSATSPPSTAVCPPPNRQPYCKHVMSPRVKPCACSLFRLAHGPALRGYISTLTETLYTCHGIVKWGMMRRCEISEPWWWTVC
jgi:hypothetical protein